ncbi:hypothetical protein POL68_01990 [Stigmatella sp. ncwal1]|uniref:Lipoprotein n=1 Tax=Stigmatella ashevillensis TaxID=2995309 RepID=A0ABT5D0N7_9BACT|nr:hypothetical protein [Stigmatella ashevillena]MDC0707230.1 hypothetical protein [Stigmatella ashevillena]
MIKACALSALAVVLHGCAVPAKAWKGEVQWPTEHSSRLAVPAMEAGAALAAAAAIREMIQTHPFPNLFWGCSSPEQGLDTVVFTGPTPGLYYVVVDQRFDRCQGPRVRVLDGWYVYAVTPQGEVVAQAPIPQRGPDPESGQALPSVPSPAPSLESPPPIPQETGEP